MFMSPIAAIPAALALAVCAGCATAPAPQSGPPAAAAEAPRFVESVAEAEPSTPAKPDNPLLEPPADTAPPSAPVRAAQAEVQPSEMDDPKPPAVASQDESDIDRVTDRINRITTLRADFTQIDRQGFNQGRFFLSRPGRVRFEYDDPNAPLVVADGDRVVVHDRKMDTYSRARINETPLRLLLQQDIDLRRDAKITQVRRGDGLLMVSAEETEGYGQGHITFIFAEPRLDLQRWIVTDPMGSQTTITLQNVEAGVELSSELFETPAEAIEFGSEL